MPIANLPAIRACRPAWNKGRVVGQKRPLQPKHVWAIRVRLEIARNHRDLALFNLAIDSKLRGCDLVKLRVADVYASGQVKERASIVQSKTQRPVRFEITEGTRKSLSRWMEEPMMVGSEYLWPGRFHDRPHISTRQYARLVRDWVRSIGLDSTSYGTHSMRRTKVAHTAASGWLEPITAGLGQASAGFSVLCRRMAVVSPQFPSPLNVPTAAVGRDFLLRLFNRTGNKIKASSNTQ
ncbi:tyrosine-type recombinase/integrase [Leisingera sp. D0M16]|uniref:tyrosine-type recombinase/integrase n=1 Tax=Leisingera coralii TaxID=3351347 RepID=UPI003B7A61CD